MRDLLRNTYLFSKLDEQQLGRVVDLSRKRVLVEGERLFEAGDQATHFYLITAGHIKLTRLAPNGNEKVIELVGAGHTFAEALMFADAPTYPVSATAIERSDLLAFDNKAFIALLRESVDTCFRMMSDMSQRLRRMIKEIDDLTLQTAIGRVAGFLCAKHALEKQGCIEFDLDTPKGIIASRLSVKPETFSRILGTFSSQ
ncbi:MAG TPA: Crp/Fnr family transcriptional regulator, partial [Gammaproteobacteria bacterium]